jgi:hypothetical protein
VAHHEKEILKIRQGELLERVFQPMMDQISQKLGIPKEVVEYPPTSEMRVTGEQWETHYNEITKGAQMQLDNQILNPPKFDPTPFEEMGRKMAEEQEKRILDSFELPQPDITVGSSECKPPTPPT